MYVSQLLSKQNWSKSPKKKLKKMFPSSKIQNGGLIQDSGFFYFKISKMIIFQKIFFAVFFD
jgi:hypothetical protein